MQQQQCPMTLLTIALAGAHGRLEAARPMRGTAIAVRLFRCAGQDLPAAERARETLTPQKGLAVPTLAMLTQCMATYLQVATEVCDECAVARAEA
jgi:hypothetical protein